MYRASTVLLHITFPETVKIDLFYDCLITFKQDECIILEKKLKDCSKNVDDNSLSLELTQEEANMFSAGAVDFQARMLFLNGKSVPTEIITLLCDDVLNDEVMNLEN